MTKTRGVYFLANDRLIDMTIAFLNSFRKHNPAIPLCFIPFDDCATQVAALAERYQFSIFSNSAALGQCDEISLQCLGRANGIYRKLALWEGEFDEFVYMDADTVVLASVEFVFDFLADYDFVNSHSNLPHLRQWVWKDSIESAGRLTAEQIAYSANMGFIASRKEALPLGDVIEKLPAALELHPHMELFCKEQPLLNYLFVTSGRPYTSLLTLWKERGRPREIALERWAGGRIGFVWAGRILFPRRPRVLLVHWAGEWQFGKFDDYILSALRHLGVLGRLRKKAVSTANDRRNSLLNNVASTVGAASWTGLLACPSLFPQPDRPRPAMRFFIRHGRLWRHYRNLTWNA